MHTEHLDEIDLLRAVAVLLVLGRHVLVLPHSDSTLVSIISFWKNFGWIGVDLFFVLSGFLVSRLLFREYMLFSTMHPGRFLVRRALKLYPAFYFFLIFGTLLIYPLTKTPIVWSNAAAEIFFLQNYVGSLWLHTWTLAVEEHFYLFLMGSIGIMISVSKDKNPIRFVPLLFVVVSTVALTGRLWMGYGLSNTWDRMFLPSHFRIDSLLFGVLLSYGFHFHPAALKGFVDKRRFSILFISLALITPPFFLKLENSTFLSTFGLSFLYVGFGGLLLLSLLLNSRHKKTLLQRLALFRVIGRHSYSIYLWHIAAFVLSSKLAGMFSDGRVSVGLVMGLYLPGSVLLGMGMSTLIEQPFLRWRNRTYPSRCGNLSVPG